MSESVLLQWYRGACARLELSSRDTLRIRELLVQLSPNRDLSEERFQRQLQLTLLNSHLLVARGDEFKEILGMGVLAPVYKLTASAGHVEDVVVHSSARGRGIGKILMLEIIDAARCNLELESLTLTSDPNNPRRQVARELYRKLDFEERDGLFTLHFNI